ncbi:hypothetical protein IWZ01DRAFT_368499 [Phyllosticta capitalensis]|uniref:Uncharacterized protein n=1 Tax=Phyllosticta capitalensis TaxID=121624 RepID=A0ABR1YAA4_9PEZI
MLLPFGRQPCNVILYTIVVTLQCLLIYSYTSSKRNAILQIKEETSLRIIEGAAHKNFTRPIPFSEFPPKPADYEYSKTIVVGRLKAADVSWINELPEMATAIYVVDHPEEGDLTVPMNKGHEAMVYLTYIIDNYDSLPDIVFFFHSDRYAWHNNPLLKGGDSVETIKRMNLGRVARFGYMNTRCHLDPGCPDWIHLDRPYVDAQELKKSGEMSFTTRVWRELFPGHKAPTALAAPCCAQFAVSGERILETSREQYIHLRKWLMETDLQDFYSGRVFEYLWQYIFMRESQYCPAEHSCYCDGYGLCFGSAENYQRFWSVRREREYLQNNMASMQAIQFKGDAQQIENIEHQIFLLQAQEEALVEEAWKRGKNPDMRAVEAERIEI